MITNYDPRTLSDAERQALNTRAGANPGNFVLIDIRPGHPGGDFPLFGALKLRSFNTILSFVAADHGASGEYEVTRDPRTGDSGPNPRRALEIEVTAQAPPGLLPHTRYAGRYYAVADTPLGPPGVHPAVLSVPDDRDRRRGRRRADHDQQVDHGWAADVDAAATLVWQPILSWLQHQAVLQT